MKTLLAEKQTIDVLLAETRAAKKIDILTWYRPVSSIKAEKCRAVYQAIHAADLAASYANIATAINGDPIGTHDCVPGITPSWSADNGWIGDRNGYLVTDVIPNNPFTVGIRFSGNIYPTSGGCALFGANGVNYGYYLYDLLISSGQQFGYGGYFTDLKRYNTLPTYTLFMSAGNIYINGVNINNTGWGWINYSAVPIYLLTTPYGGGTIYRLKSGSVQWFCYWEQALTGDEIMAVHEAGIAL